jgi:hypothetical protein
MSVDFWVVTLYSLVDSYQRFGRYLQGDLKVLFLHISHGELPCDYKLQGSVEGHILT